MRNPGETDRIPYFPTPNQRLLIQILMITPGELIQLVSPKGKRYLRIFDPNAELHTHDGKLSLGEISSLNYGDCIISHLGKRYTILKPSLYDLLKNIKRKTQVIYPKEIGYILLKLSVAPGATVIEAGCGSGALTMALAWFVGQEGQVHSFERRPEFQALCASNLDRVKLLERVTFHTQDIQDGFAVGEADAVFIDVRTPWEYLDQVLGGIKNGHPVGFLLPTMNQVSLLLAALEQKPFTDLEVLEIFLRKYKAVPERLRPEDRMVAHTGFLVFARARKEHLDGGVTG